MLSTVGTDFTLMATLFPGRTRKCMKRKFKKEEKTSPELIMKALSCKQNFNIDLLEKELRKLNLSSRYPDGIIHSTFTYV